jgi:signal transduction histidine kinase
MTPTRGLQPDDGTRTESLAVLAHVLRGPLAEIATAVSILDAPSNDLGSVKRARAVIRRQLDCILRLVEEIQDATAISTGELGMRMERVDLTGVVQHAVDGARPLVLAASHTLVLQVPACAMYVDADPLRLSQVLTNLIENSAQVCRKHGRIVICLGRDADDAILRVQYDGAAPETGGSYGGFGIGLNRIKRIVELHGGTVSARCEGPGAGSEFIVRIPATSTRSRGPDELRSGIREP